MTEDPRKTLIDAIFGEDIRPNPELEEELEGYLEEEAQGSDRIDLTLDIALTYSDLGEYDQSETYFYKALDQGLVQRAEILPCLQRMYEKAEQWGKAVDIHKEVMDIGPVRNNQILHHVVLLSKAGRTTEAIAYAKLTETKPGGPMQ